MRTASALADGPLLDLPFALVRAPREIDPDRELLISARSLCMPVSLGPGEPRRARGRRGRRPLVALADPIYRPTSLPLGATMSDGAVSWRDRAASRREAEQLAAEIEETTRLFGRQATREALVGSSSKAVLLHLALEAREDAADPGASYLLLAPGEPSAPPQRVRAVELARQLRLEAELVVRSGNDRPGAEVGLGGLPFAAAFELAGARQSVVSLWRVTQESSVSLFGSFYRHLADGRSPVEALRLAQLELPEEPAGGEGSVTVDTRHPFYWAGLQVYGDCR